MDFLHDAELTIHSVIDNLNDAGLPEGEPEINIITADGCIRERASSLEISYTEANEGGKAFSALSISNDGAVTLERSGSVKSTMHFSEGEEYRTLYTVAPYSFDMTVKTLRVRSSMTRDGGELSLFYLMNIGGQDKKVKMKITARVK